jgi:hypothetical protein
MRLRLACRYIPDKAGVNADPSGLITDYHPGDGILTQTGA